MFKRKINSEFDEWKEYCTKVKKKALVITGARQVGKTTSIIDYAKNHYKSYLYLDFYNDKELKAIFDKDFDINRMIFSLSLRFPDIKLYPNESVLIFDEIQECSLARMALKYFALDGRYDVIASGSLLGVKGYNRSFDAGIPVGYEYMVQMKSLDFEEFLLAMDYADENTISYLKDCLNKRKKIDELLHKKLLSCFEEYLLVGGLPEVVTAYKNTHQYSFCLSALNSIISEYQHDFGKHLNKREETYVNSSELNKILLTFKSIPNQIAKQNIRFKFSEISSNSRRRDFISAVEYLEDAGLINLCYNLKTLSLPLALNVDDSAFKIYVDEPGIMAALLDPKLREEMLFSSLGSGKGALYENIISSTLVRNKIPLYYFYKSSGLEIDFIIDYQNELTLVEVKAENGATKSSRYILDNFDTYHVKNMIKFTSSNIGYHDGVLTLPLYLAFLIKS